MITLQPWAVQFRPPGHKTNTEYAGLAGLRYLKAGFVTQKPLNKFVLLQRKKAATTAEYYLKELQDAIGQ